MIDILLLNLVCSALSYATPPLPPTFPTGGALHFSDLALSSDEDARRRVEASSLGLMVNEKFDLGPPGFGARFEWDGIAGAHMRRVMLKVVLPAMETYVQVTHG
jgi:hypothetical protein